MSLTPKQQKKLAKVKEIEDDSVLTLANDLVELEEKIETEVETLKEIVLQVEAQKGDVGERGERGEIGPKGDRGDVGARGEKGEKGDSGKDGRDGIDGKDGYTPIKGKDYFDGVDGKNGKDGEPDKKTKKLVVTLEKDVKTIKDYDIPTLQNRTQLLNQIASGLQRQIDNIEDNDSFNPVDYIQFNTSATPLTNAEGLLQWNSTDETLDLGMPDGITLQIGQEQQIKVRNNTGATILNGRPVYQTGMLGNRPTVAYAKGDDHSTGHALGLLTQDIANNADGKVTTSGYVRNINTTGSPFGETWADGDELWVSTTTAGGLTNIEPNAPHHSCLVGSVVNAHATQGSILVRMREHIELEQLSDVDGSAPNATGDLLSWNNTSATWERNAYNITDYALTSSLSAYAKLDGSNHPFTYVKTPKIYPASDSTTALQILKADGTTSIMNFDTTNGRIGVGTDTPFTQFEVSGTTGGLTLTRTSDVAADEPFILLRKGVTPANIAQLRGIHGGGLRFTNGASDVEWARFASTGYYGLGVVPSTDVFNRTSKALTQISANFSVGSYEGTHTQNADNAFQWKGIYSLVGLNAAGFNNTNALSAGGGLTGNYVLAQLSSTPATGTVTAISGHANSVRNTGGSVLTNAVSFLALPVLNSGAGSVTNAFGFYSSALTVGTNNYGFYGASTAATGRWNLYMAGTAQNYLAGFLGVGITVPLYKGHFYDSTNTDVGVRIGSVSDSYSPKLILSKGTTEYGDIRVYSTGTFAIKNLVSNKDLAIAVNVGGTDTQVLTIQGSTGNLVIANGKNISVNSTTGTKIGIATTEKIGFWNVTPVIQQVTNAYTSDGEGSAYTGIDNLQLGTPYAQVTDLNALRVAYETLRASYDDLLTKLKNTGIVA